MRHWLLILLIALLPLRGWADGALVVSQPGSAAASAVPCQADAPAASTDSHRASAAVALAHGPDHTESGDRLACNVCDVCHVPALMRAVPLASGSPSALDRAAASCEAFASAVPRQGNKPPIA